MKELFINVSSFVLLSVLFLTAYSVEGQRKSSSHRKSGASRTSRNHKKTTTSSSQTTIDSSPTTQSVVPNRIVQSLLARIQTNTGIYRRELTRALSRSNLNGTDSESSINSYVSDFENSTKNLASRVDSGNDTVADVQDVLNRAEFIQSFLQSNSLSPSVQSQWKLVASNLITLASSYNLSWNINTTPNQTNQSYNSNGQQTGSVNQTDNSNTRSNNNRVDARSSSRFDSMLTGTYRLNANQSDNAATALDKALNNNQNNSTISDDLRRTLERRLTASEMLVIDKKGERVTLASNLSRQITFAADNTARNEINSNGRTVSVKAASLSNVLEISYQGDNINDFFITFMPIDNNQMRVTRRLYLQDRNQTVTITSMYDKILPTADFSVVNNSNNQNNSNNTNDSNQTNTYDFVIPNGTQLTAALRSTISTQAAREGDRYTMEVRSPSQYAGAIIEGFVSNTQQAARVSGNVQITFNFNTIQLRNGSTYRFNGFIDLVRLPGGDTVRVANESTASSVANTTRQPPSRSGIGDTLGAILGAIITGGQAAPADNGSVVGSGSGSIILQGQDNLDLQSGSEFRITSSAPANLKANH